MLATTAVRPISADQYEGIVRPRPHMTSQELFEFQRATLDDKKLAPVGMFDHFASRLPKHGLFLLVPPQPKAPDWKDLMVRVELDGKTGVNYLDPWRKREEPRVFCSAKNAPSVIGQECFSW